MVSVPFRVGETVHGEGYFMDRADEVARVRRAIRDRERLLVYGERRLGKSSVIRRAAWREREETGALVIWADLWSLIAVADVLRAILASIPWSWAPRERLFTLLARADVRPTLVADPATNRIGVQLGWRNQELDDARARDLLAATLSSLDRVAAEHEAPISIVLDEFQEIDRIADEGGGYLRSIVQQTGRLGYVLAGSTLSLVDNLVSPTGPFYNIPRLDLGPIDGGEMARWIEDRMRTHGVRPAPGVGEEIVTLAGSSTEARVTLARETFVGGLGRQAANIGEVTEAFSQIVDSRASGFEVTWADLSDMQRRMLQVLAHAEERPYARATLVRYGVTASGTAVKAVHALRGKALLLATDPPAIADPFFAGWIRRRTDPTHSRLGLPST